MVILMMVLILIVFSVPTPVLTVNPPLLVIPVCQVVLEILNPLVHVPKDTMKMHLKSAKNAVINVSPVQVLLIIVLSVLEVIEVLPSLLVSVTMVFLMMDLILIVLLVNILVSTVQL